ncbi:hypothetical protein R5W23_005464 [Gemmata sp. JC673]|uniref:Uncharacterized protein n=1 Tax=Gemmata algarum TaxID=2975278 RepID=A0ABU5EXF2_9BACT|nr:hypothetical protein [Gemmata algarum]MDY3558371.1 hypothetical protein [Gemmata algarum]
MRWIPCVLATALFAGVATEASAQQIMIAWGDEVNTLLLTNAALQAEIKLTGEQKGKLRPVTEKQAKFNKEFTDAFGPDAKAGFDLVQFNVMREKQAELAAEVKTALDNALTADQRKRLKQIALQAMNFVIFNDPDVAPKGPAYTDAQKAAMKEVGAALKLSDEQKKAVNGLADGVSKDSRKIREEAALGGLTPAGVGLDPEKVAAVNAKLDKVRKEAWVKVETALNESQKKTWKELVGEPFDLAKLRPTPKK